MKRLLLIAILMSSAPAWSQEADLGSETAHLRFVWKDGELSEEGIQALEEAGERFYVALFERLGQAPEHKIPVLMEGPAQQADGSWKAPHVDGWGRVHLYKYGPSYHDYMGAFAHELVHAMRIQRRPHHDWFFEEGFAEFLALRVDDDLRGFPWYDFPVVIVAGQWLAEGEELPLGELKARHRELNMPCKAQSYSLRSAFFDYLGRQYGDEAVLAMGKAKEAGAEADYPTLFGSPFPALVEEWRAELLESFHAIEDAAAQGKAYRTETPVQYWPVCGPDGP